MNKGRSDSFKKPDYASEFADFAFDLSTEHTAEKTIRDFLAMLGLTRAYRGTEFLVRIFLTCVKTLSYCRSYGEYYRIAAEFYHVGQRYVRSAIKNALGILPPARLNI